MTHVHNDNEKPLEDDDPLGRWDLKITYKHFDAQVIDDNKCEVLRYNSMYLNLRHSLDFILSF